MARARGGLSPRGAGAHRRYFSGILVMRPSGSHTPSGRVVPTSPGWMAVMETDAAAVAARGASAAW